MRGPTSENQRDFDDEQPHTTNSPDIPQRPQNREKGLGVGSRRLFCRSLTTGKQIANVLV